MQRKWPVIASFLLALMLATGCPGAGSPPLAGELTVLNHEIIKGEAGTAAVKVTVKNVGRVNAELAQVTVKFYDTSKNLIDSSSDSVMNLGPGETWDFEITCEGTRCHEVSSYEIETTAGTSSGGL